MMGRFDRRCARPGCRKVAHNGARYCSGSCAMTAAMDYITPTTATFKRRRPVTRGR